MTAGYAWTPKLLGSRWGKTGIKRARGGDHAYFGHSRSGVFKYMNDTSQSSLFRNGKCLMYRDVDGSDITVGVDFAAYESIADAGPVENTASRLDGESSSSTSRLMRPTSIFSTTRW